MPKRIQRRRTKGWRMPEGAVNVCRPSRHGNPFRVGVDGDAAECVAQHRRWVEAEVATSPDYLDDVRGRDLVCWCPLDAPCHADTLLELANRT